MGTVRSFVALELSPAVRGGLAAELERLAREHREFRWVAPATLHLTLKFLGDVDEGRLPEVEAALREAAARSPRTLDWSMQGGGAFPGRGRPARVIWVGIQAGPELGALQQRVEAALEAIGLPREARAFSPHLTLARSRSQSGEPAPWLESLSGRDFGHIQSAEMVLFRSTLTPGGAIYTPLARIPLG